MIILYWRKKYAEGMKGILSRATKDSLSETPEYFTKALYSPVHGGFDDRLADRLERYNVLRDRGENRTKVGFVDPEFPKNFFWIQHKATLLGAHFIENGFPQNFRWWIFKQECKIFIQWLFGRSGGVPPVIYAAIATWAITEFLTTWYNPS